MSLYLAIVLLAVLVGFGGDDDWVDEVALIWGTAIGLGIAHLFAYRLTAVFAAGGRPVAEDYWAALGIAVAVVATATLATVPYLIWGDTADASTGSSVVLMGLIGLAGYRSVRHAGASTPRALLYTAMVLVGAAMVVLVKFSLTH